MMTVFYLIIAHLLGDFVFQPNALIKWKHESWRGTLVHALIVTAFSGILIFPYMITLKAFWLLILLFTAHFAQDNLKIIYQRREYGKRAAWPFFVDQALHVFFIWVFGSEISKLPSLALPANFLEVYQSQNLLLFTGLAIFFTFALDIVKFELFHVKHGAVKYHRDYCGISYRLIAFIVSYALFLMVLALGQ